MARIWLAGFVLAYSVAAGGASFGEDEIRSCYHQRSGKLRVETATAPCRPNEASLVWNRTGPPGPKGTPGGGLEVRDVNGRYVGTYVGSISSFYEGYEGLAARQVEGSIVPLLVIRDGLVTRQVHFVFETSNCVGTPLVQMELAPPAAQFDGSTVYYATGPSETRKIYSHSYRPYDERSCDLSWGGTVVGPDECCFDLSGFDSNVSRVGTIAVEELGLVPPFHVELAAGE